MAVRLDPIRAVPCTYDHCGHSFNTEAEMRTHKIAESDHFYCKKCDLDTTSWVDLTQHKVDLMAPFLEGKMKGLGEHPKHIVCEFCGEDFRSFGGRKKHRDTMHKADQSITCPGCSRMFVRASHMIDHLERNSCPVITAYNFRVSIQEKYIVSEVMDDPGTLMHNLDRFDRSATQSYPPTITSGNESQNDTDFDSDSEEGGVSLLGHDDAPTEEPPTRRTLQAWPQLPGHAPAPKTTPQSLSKQMEKLSVTSTTDGSVSELQLPPGLFARTVRDSTVASSTDDKSVATTEKEYANAWGSGVSSRALFPQAKATPASAETMNALEKARMSIQAAKDTPKLNYCNYRADESDTSRFFDRTIDRYICPFPACQRYNFVTADDIKKHFIWAHTKQQFQCPACLKVFWKPSALIAHAESTNTCRIQQAAQFKQLIDDMSGGYLKAKILRQPAIYRPSTDLVKVGQPMNGVMTAQFKGRNPSATPKW